MPSPNDSKDRSRIYLAGIIIVALAGILVVAVKCNDSIPRQQARVDAVMNEFVAAQDRRDKSTAALIAALNNVAKVCVEKNDGT